VAEALNDDFVGTNAVIDRVRIGFEKEAAGIFRGVTLPANGRSLRNINAPRIRAATLSAPCGEWLPI
jgi:hypothetical protein